MSRRSEEPATPAERIEALRKTIPPPKDRRARNAYISKDDFADLLGTGRSTVITWTKGKGYPDEENRKKLAKLSRGRFEPDDFANPDERAARQWERRLEPRVAALEETVGRLARHILGAEEAQQR